MITEIEKIQIKQVLGFKYSAAIAKHLTENGITNLDGNKFSQSSIRQFVCGNRENSTVELEILRLTKAKLKQIQVLQNKRAKLLNR